MTLGQRVAVMRDGRILQVDRPQKLYEAPCDLYVAAFIGSPAMNLVEAKIDGDHVVFGQYRLPLDPARRPPRPRTSCSASGPRASRMPLGAPAGLPTIDVSVAVLEELGADSHVFFRVDAPRITAEMLEAQDEATLLAEPSAAQCQGRSQESRASRRAARADRRSWRSTSSTANPVKRSSQRSSREWT